MQHYRKNLFHLHAGSRGMVWQVDIVRPISFFSSTTKDIARCYGVEIQSESSWKVKVHYTKLDILVFMIQTLLCGGCHMVNQWFPIDFSLIQ